MREIYRDGGPFIDLQKNRVQVNINGQLIEAPSSDPHHQINHGGGQFPQHESGIDFHHASNDIYYSTSDMSCP